MGNMKKVKKPEVVHIDHLVTEAYWPAMVARERDAKLAAQAEAEVLRLEVKELRECLAEILRWDGSGEVFDAFKVYDAREHARRLLESGAELEVVSVDC